MYQACFQNIEFLQLAAHFQKLYIGLNVKNEEKAVLIVDMKLQSNLQMLANII